MDVVNTPFLYIIFCILKRWIKQMSLIDIISDLLFVKGVVLCIALGQSCLKLFDYLFEK